MSTTQDGPTNLSVGIIGCGMMGQTYADAYQAYSDCDLVAIAETNEARRAELAAGYPGVRLYADYQAMLAEGGLDIVSVITPTKYTPAVVVACAQAGVQAVSADKPICGSLAEADAMLAACREAGVIFSGGNLQRAMPEVQQAARWIREGRLGVIQGVSFHLGGEVSGGGVQDLCVARLFVGAEVEWVMGWVQPLEAASAEHDQFDAWGLLHFTNGVQAMVFPPVEAGRGVRVWGADGLIHWNWGPPEVYVGFDEDGARLQVPAEYEPYDYAEFGYLTGALRSMISAAKGETVDDLAVSGYDLCQAVEIAIALRESARLGHAKVRLPLEDRSLRLEPVPYRWLGGEATRGRYPDDQGRRLDNSPYRQGE